MWWSWIFPGLTSHSTTILGETNYQLTTWWAIHPENNSLRELKYEEKKKRRTAFQRAFLFTILTHPSWHSSTAFFFQRSRFPHYFDFIHTVNNWVENPVNLKKFLPTGITDIYTESTGREWGNLWIVFKEKLKAWICFKKCVWEGGGGGVNSLIAVLEFAYN